ncbi:hypothetical protein C8R46DRAFT_1040877 [Mycena filopes]|nr:hypothetical protein C8R46DRAFT_1040877 [Mycena filopes]
MDVKSMVIVGRWELAIVCEDGLGTQEPHMYRISIGFATTVETRERRRRAAAHRGPVARTTGIDTMRIWYWMRDANNAGGSWWKWDEESRVGKRSEKRNAKVMYREEGSRAEKGQEKTGRGLERRLKRWLEIEGGGVKMMMDSARRGQMWVQEAAGCGREMTVALGRRVPRRARRTSPALDRGKCIAADVDWRELGVDADTYVVLRGGREEELSRWVGTDTGKEVGRWADRQDVGTGKGAQRHWGVCKGRRATVDAEWGPLRRWGSGGSAGCQGAGACEGADKEWVGHGGLTAIEPWTVRARLKLETKGTVRGGCVAEAERGVEREKDDVLDVRVGPGTLRRTCTIDVQLRRRLTQGFQSRRRPVQVWSKWSEKEKRRRGHVDAPIARPGDSVFAPEIDSWPCEQ